MKKILIVDDEPAVLEFLTAILERKGYEVMKAMDGMQAVSQAMKGKPDLVILDMMMPAGSGVTVYNRIRQSILTRNIPIVILTAMPVENARGKFPDGDQLKVFSKPCDSQELIAAIESLIP